MVRMVTTTTTAAATATMIIQTTTTLNMISTTTVTASFRREKYLYPHFSPAEAAQLTRAQARPWKVKLRSLAAATPAPTTMRPMDTSTVFH
jgi:hypothetical protein